ncbi:MAG TPA: 5-deoxy-glucuronate isomerase [Terriglobia bacterium]|nr:5-deoxy-glucuronate isomerase [Terriglobia bacterium]
MSKAAELLRKPEAAFIDTPESVHFDYLTFRTHDLARDHKFTANTAGNELCLVLLGGRCSVESSVGSWRGFGERAHVFGGLPTALYLPIETRFSVVAETDCQIALCFSRAETVFPAHLITPDEVEVEIRGGGNATRQINHILKPEFRAQRLMVVEVFTPSGNWSSYPPHKHDVHDPPAEVDLEEIYYYKIDRPEGYAIQRIYTADRKLDATLTVRDGELVLVPEGYHPVAAAHGYTIYYLNALAGSARSMAASDDPDYAWVRQTWNTKEQGRR